MGDGIFDKYMGLAMDVMVGSSFEESLNNIEDLLKNMPTDTSSVMPESTTTQADSLQ